MLKQWYLPTLALSKSGHRSGQTAHSQPAFASSLFCAHTTVQLYLQVVPGLAMRSERGKMRKNKKGKHHEHYSLSWGK